MTHHVRHAHDACAAAPAEFCAYENRNVDPAGPLYGVRGVIVEPRPEFALGGISATHREVTIVADWFSRRAESTPEAPAVERCRLGGGIIKLQLVHHRDPALVHVGSGATVHVDEQVSIDFPDGTHDLILLDCGETPEQFERNNR